MWRTWLFTVSWEMNSCAATSAFERPSARSCEDLSLTDRQDVRAAPALRERRHQSRIDERLARSDLLDRPEQRLVGRFLEDVPAGAGLEAALEECAFRVGGEDENLGVGDAPNDLLGRFDPVHPGHPQVHDDHIG